MILPPVTADAITQLTQAMREVATNQRDILREQRETNRLLRNEKKEWLSAEEAAEMLGKPITRSGSYKRVLAYARPALTRANSIPLATR